MTTINSSIDSKIDKVGVGDRLTLINLHLPKNDAPRVSVWTSMRITKSGPKAIYLEDTMYRRKDLGKIQEGTFFNVYKVAIPSTDKMDIEDTLHMLKDYTLGRLRSRELNLTVQMNELKLTIDKLRQDGLECLNLKHKD